MGKIYSENQNVSKPRKACPATVQFLINYSKSLDIITYNNIQFENNLN
ncbi:hypothetical protein H0I25_12895 [Cellulophaga sp. HaHa_2_95]|jgi:hypothetical protein|uniref:Uncharacterized protein n=1 Tax=Cellulophaga baltica TaxID=76594 RepID=A0A1G7IZQ4_9FLAO|nr:MULTISPECIES: hypothetical protein [Cellulophaga]QXP54977.1 hypothetical protein H0I25_12895 [Cellulophaga sp. HaHa_2_95]SDF18093.1 hypothetical protein SAMN04487992_108125 [Cellulophaga baltica]